MNWNWCRDVLTHEGRFVCRSNILSDQLIWLEEDKTDDLKGLPIPKLVCFFFGYVSWPNERYYVSLQALNLFYPYTILARTPLFLDW